MSDWVKELPRAFSAGSLRSTAPGSLTRWDVPVAVRASGDILQLSIHVARGGRPGPVLGLMATVAGDAAWGARVIKETLSRLPLDQLSGTIVALPIANPIAFESFTRTTGQGMNTDMNGLGSTFPGNPDGWLTERMAAVITEYFYDNVDVVVSYASGADTTIHYALVNGEETETERKSRDLTRLLGTRFVFIYDKSPHARTSTEFAKSLGKVVVIAEFGGTGALPEGYLDQCVTATDNLMKGLGMLPGEPVLPDSQLIMRPPRVLPRIAHGGIFEPLVGAEAIDQILEQGTPLGRVFNPHTFEELQVFTAPYPQSAMFNMRTRFGRVNPGDYAYIIGDASRAEVWDRPTDWRIDL
jgi:predicted deacylase